MENRQHNLLRLRMYLAEEMVQITKNTKSSRTKSFVQALSNMRSLITSSASAVDKRVFSLKVSCYDTAVMFIYILSFFHELDNMPQICLGVAWLLFFFSFFYSAVIL